MGYLLFYIGNKAKRKFSMIPLLPLPCSVCGVFLRSKNIGEGSVRTEGLKRPAKARAKSPPLSGGEVARKTEEKGRGLSERSEFRRPRRRPRRRAEKPDNCGSASWFVLLAAEKNEQIKRINVTRTFFDRERKSLVFNLLPLPCPVCGGIALQ